MAVQIQLRRDTAADWTSGNPTLAAGEIGFESDTNQIKLGDGATAWTSLAYWIAPPRVTTEASAAEPTINTDNSDAHSITALAVAITSFTTNLSGTPINFQKLIIRILDNGTGRAIAWGASFEDNGVALPTTSSFPVPTEVPSVKSKGNQVKSPSTLAFEAVTFILFAHVFSQAIILYYLSLV